MTKEQFLDYFIYDNLTGNLIWKNHWCINRKKFIGKIAGSYDSKGYRVVAIKRKNYKLHRVVWFLENGNWPKQIDHISGIKNDNRIENLRIATNRENQINKQIHRNGKLPGCWFDKSRKKWRAEIIINNKKIYLGQFNTALEGHQKYMEVSRGIL